MKTLLAVPALALAIPGAAAAQPADSTARWTFGAYVDAYYAYDLGRPRSRDRAFTTQATRHDEFSVNLAHVSAHYGSRQVRGRIALQAGTSVQVNYAGEPDELTGGQPNYLPLLQEAYAGVSPAEGVWIDAGIFFSHIGSEGWISAEQPNHTRSLPAEFSPYYSAGVRATWQATPSLTAHVHLMNGWQLLSDNNEDKAVGVRLDWAANPALTVSYANFLGREAHAATGEHDLRFFNDLVVRYAPDPRLLVIATGDVGSQDDDSWWTASLVGRYRVTPTVGVAGRIERMDDADGVVAATGVPGGPGLVASAASLGLDVARGPALWRTEVKAFFGADEEIFPDRDADGGFAESSLAVVTSLSIRL